MARNKYRAVRTNGYASKFEARVASEVHALAASRGYVVEEQVAIKFACGTKYLCDFVMTTSHASRWYIEAKGKETPVWRLKLRMLKHEYPEIYEKMVIVYARNKKGKLKKGLGGWIDASQEI